MRNPPDHSTMLVWAVVYKRTLAHVPDDEPLKGTSYLGQTVRGGYGSAIQLARRRWVEENGESVRMEKQVGLTAALRIFGIDAFHNEVLQSKYGPRGEVQAWADKLEVDFIAEHGGTLRDMEPQQWIHQTFNIEKGGKGKTWWVAMEALNTKRWTEFKRELQAYVDEFANALVPTLYEKNGYRLGLRVVSVRQGQMLKGRPDEAERRAWLASLPKWQWNALHAQETCDARSKRLEEEWSNPDKRADRIEGMRKRNAVPEVKANRSKAAKKRMSNPAVVSAMKATKAGLHEQKLQKRIIDARLSAMPYEPSKAKRLTGHFYHYPKDGSIRMWNGFHLKIVGPIVVPQNAEISSNDGN